MAVTAPRTTTSTRTQKGVSLSRGPALILGTILLVAGLYFLYEQHTFPKLSNFPNGSAPVEGKVFLGIFGANGWTGMLTAAAGGLLLFGAAEHVLAKAMSLIVGVALGAAAIIALASGDVLGLAAANHLTELAWGVAAVIMLFNTIIPRRRRTVVVAEQGTGVRARRVAPAAAHADAAGAGAATTAAPSGTVADGEDGYAGDRAAHGSERSTATGEESPVVQREGVANDPAAGTATQREAQR